MEMMAGESIINSADIDVKCLSRGICLICNTEYDYIRSASPQDRSDSSLSELKTAFALFCKLLNVQYQVDSVLGKYLDDGITGSENQSGFGTEKVDNIKSEEGQSISIAGSTAVVPCCEQCQSALLAVLELQKLIEIHQTSQREQVEHLKNSLLKPCCDNTATNPLCNCNTGEALFWVQIRDYLTLRLAGVSESDETIESIQDQCHKREREVQNAARPVDVSSQFNSLFQQLPLKKKRGRKPKKLPVKAESQDEIAEKTRNRTDWKMKPCSVLLDRASVKNEHEWKTEDNINPDSGRPVRRSKLKAYGVIKQAFAVTSDTEDYEEKNSSSTVRTSASETHRKRKKTDIINIKQDNITTNKVVAGLNEESRTSSPDAFVPSPGAFVSEAESDCLSDLDDECLDPPVIKQKRKHTKTKGLQVAKPKRRRKARSNYFLLIQDYMVLYKFTVVRVLEGNFVCGEQDCGTVVEGTDYHAFGELREHINDVHYKSGGYINVPRICPCCNESFSGGEDFRSHLVISHLIKKSVCECCWRPVSSSMTVHMWSHKNEAERVAALAAGFQDPAVAARKKREVISGNFPCEQCDKVFRFKNLYSAHKLTHLPRSERKMFECSQCNAKLLSLPALQGHIERLHNPELASRVRVCPICNDHFNWRAGEHYRAHVRSHKNERPFVCEVCGLGFIRKAALKKHRTVHASVRKFQCEFCTESYKYTGGLKRHQLSAHKDLVPARDPAIVSKFTFGSARPDFIGPRIAFPCEFCDKVFQLRSRMTKHVKMYHSNLLSHGDYQSFNNKIEQESIEHYGNDDVTDALLSEDIKTFHMSEELK